MPDDVKRICLLFYYSVPEHFVNDRGDRDLQFSKKKKLVTIPRRPPLHCDYSAIDGGYTAYRSGCGTDHVLSGSNIIEPFLKKDHFWRFNVSPRLQNVSIGIVEHSESTKESVSLFYSYCSNGSKSLSRSAVRAQNDYEQPFGLSFGGDRYDTVRMELNFTKNRAGGILSFGRGIQTLRVAFDGLDRAKRYKMCVAIQSQLFRDAATVELLDYNEYYAADKVSPWRRVWGFCQRPKAKRRRSSIEATAASHLCDECVVCGYTRSRT